MTVEPKRRLREIFRRIEPLLALLTLVTLVLVLMNAAAVRSWLHLGSDGSSSSAAEPITAPPTDDPNAPTPEHPFAGSPAEQWANGADGIVLPTAKAVGVMTSKQVAQALQLTKQYLIATNLDPQVLRGGRPTAALKVLDPLGNDWPTRMSAALKHPSASNDPLQYVTRYNPASFSPAGSAIKVHGTMTFKKGPNGSVVVHADYSFVYPFTEAHGDPSQVSRSIVRRILGMEMDDPSQGGITAGTLQLDGSTTDEFNQPCGFVGGYLTPSFADDAPTGKPGTGSPMDPYDLSTPTAITHQVCGVASRT